MGDMRNLPPPPGYWPPTPSQWTEPTVDDCTWFAGEFAWQAGSDIHRSMHPVDDLRAKSTDKVGGTPIEVMMDETYRLWPARDGVGYVYGGHTALELQRALTGGAVVIVGGDYEKLPLHYRRWTNTDTFDHAIAIKFLLDDNRTRMYDPLGGGPARLPYDGEWIPFSALFNSQTGFCWRDGNGKYLTGIVQNTTEGAPDVNRLFLDPTRPTTRQIRVGNKTPVYAKPSVTSVRVKTLWNSDTWRWMAGGVTGWRIIVYQDSDSPEWKVGYVNNEDVIATQDTPASTLPPDDHLETIETLRIEIIKRTEALNSANEKLNSIRAVVAL